MSLAWQSVLSLPSPSGNNASSGFPVGADALGRPPSPVSRIVICPVTRSYLSVAPGIARRLSHPAHVILSEQSESKDPPAPITRPVRPLLQTSVPSVGAATSRPARLSWQYKRFGRIRIQPGGGFAQNAYCFTHPRAGRSGGRPLHRDVRFSIL